MSNDRNRPLEELWTRFIAREALTSDERAQLAAALERDEVLRRRMITDLQLDGALRAAGEAERSDERIVAAVKALVTAAGRTEEVVAAVRKRLEAKAADPAPAHLTAPRRSRSPWAKAATILVLSAAAAMVLLRPTVDAPEAPVAVSGETAPVPAPSPFAPPAPVLARQAPAPAAPAVAAVAQLQPITGPAYRHGGDGTRRATAVLELRAGDWISTAGVTARARIAGPAAAQIELVGDAVATMTSEAAAQPAGARFFLAHGRATATIPAGATALTLASPHAIINATGSVRLEVGTSVTRVEVREGHARVSALGVQRGTDVEAGQQALVSADDLQPPRAQAAAREALLLTGPDDTKEGQQPEEALRPSEQRLKTRLEQLGFLVIVADAATLLPERAREASLIVFSSSVSSQLLAPWYSELPVPMLVLESTGFEQLGLTGAAWSRDVGNTPNMAEIAIANPTHPLAAGLSGTVRILNNPVKMRWGAPAPSASRIASWPGAPEQAALLFGYDRGAATVGGTAPARRVGLFLGNGRVIRALNDQGWRLFDAAALWAAGD